MRPNLRFVEALAGALLIGESSVEAVVERGTHMLGRR